MPSASEFVESWADDSGVFYQWPEDTVRYFDERDTSGNWLKKK